MYLTPLVDYHTHTTFSTDGSSTMREMVSAAADAGDQRDCYN